jgi:tetratricopeptide (TPR) repeat protein
MPFDVRQGTTITRLVLVFLASLAPTLARGQAAPEVGTPVVLKPGAGLRVGEKVVDSGSTHRVYKVERSEGDWVWLASGPVAGWTRSSDVIPLDRAIDYYTAEIARDSHAPWPHYHRGLIHQDLNDSNLALTDFTEAIRQDAAYLPALISRGNIWLSRRSYDRALLDFDAAIRVDPTAMAAHLNRAIALQARGDIDKALADYDEAIRLGLNTAPGYNNRGHAREMKKDYDGAIADYSEAIRRDPGYALAWMNRGGARLVKKDYKRALSDFGEANRLNPGSPLGYARRAWILATCPVARYRDGKTAVTLASKACELVDQDDASFLDVLAAAHAESGNFARSVFEETKAVGKATFTAPDQADAYRARLKLYQARKPYRDVK